jgi:formylglycine-generating enzyme required for sulfatase activity/mono/diheme cytochrome c family protein
MNARFIVAGAALCGVWTATQTALAADADFQKHIKPILESTCVSCHGAEKPKGDFALHTNDALKKGGDNGAAVVAGDPAKSPLYTTTTLKADDDDVMPPKGDLLTKEQSDMLKDWIAKGAKWPDGVTLKQVQRAQFTKDIQPILEFNCVACHRPGHAKGDLDLTTKHAALTTGTSGPSLIPWEPSKSSLYTSTILPADDENLMPPSNKGGPLPKETTELLRLWIEQGAPWPEGIVLTPKKKEDGAGADNLELVTSLHKVISERHQEKAQADMKGYTNAIPGTPVTYAMVPIPGGKFVMGSPAAEKGRKDHEGPQHEVEVEPFWMGQFEVTWNEYELFMYPTESKLAGAVNAVMPELNPLVDAVSRPTKPYVEMSFGMGKDNFPAISMTHHAANKYCQWLSAKTGHFYRLPTEAEWEYACRAGTTTAYYFGDDTSKLKEHAWYEDNSDFQYKKVGKKKANPWGLYDMHGNVAEWVLDQYQADYYKQFEGRLSKNDWLRSTKPYGHVARGGSWDHSPDKLRAAARIFSDPSWKQQDPQLPKSIWYLTDAQFLGMRIVRPLKVPTPEEIHRYWNNGVEKE